MSSKTKKRLVIALAGLLASSTAAVLVANSRTPSAQVAGDAGCLASIESACDLTPLAWDGAPLALDFAADTALATYSALSDLVGATYGESAQWRYADEFATPEERFSFEDRQLFSDISAQLGGAYHIGPQDQFQPDASGANSVEHFASMRLFAGGGGGISKSGSPGIGGPGGGSSGGGSSGGGSSPDGTAPGGSPPINSAPDGAPGGSVPGDGAPGGGTPGDGAPGGSNPGDSAPGGSTPGGSTPGGGIPDDGVPGNGGPGKPVSVPEPGTTGLLAFGLALVAFMGRRRRAPI